MFSTTRFFTHFRSTDARIVGFRVRGEPLNPTQNPKSMQNNSPKPIIIAIKAIILHTFGAQVDLNSVLRFGFRVLYSEGTAKLNGGQLLWRSVTLVIPVPQTNRFSSSVLV